MIVYEIKCKVNNKGYVGQTTRSLNTRWASHVRDALSKNSQTAIHRAIRKYGPENFDLNILEETKNIEELNKKEKYWISLKKYTNKENGYNILPGGKNSKMPKEMKQKISKALKGKKFKSHISKKEKSKIAKKNGKKTFENPEVYNKWLLANGSRKFNVYKAICVQPAKRGQKAIYEKGEFVGKWLNPVQFNLDVFGIEKRGHINNCLKGKRNQYKGYIFEYCKEIKKETKRSKNSKKKMLEYNKKEFSVYKNNKLIGIWENQVTCAKDLILDASNIGHCLKGNRKTHKG